MSYFCILEITILILIVDCLAIDWKGNSDGSIWAMGCDFKDNDLSSARTKGEDCSNLCTKTAGCSHFTWTTYNGGTCWMKRGVVSKKDAFETFDPGMVCGIILKSTDNVLRKGNLLWSDEFNSLQLLNKNWNQQTGGDGWGNRELQFYTNNNTNLFVSDGLLTIQARKQKHDWNSYTSARLISKQSFRYGVYEMKAKLPFGRGTWPAFWLLAANRPLNWPDDGEIDMMEHVGYDMNNVVATIHCKAHNHMKGTQIGSTTFVPNVDTKFHTYQLEWTSNSIKAYRDDIFYFRYDRPVNSNPDNWPFDNKFNIILNLAVGGTWGGAKGVDANIWPQDYVIDYVRHFDLV